MRWRNGDRCLLPETVAAGLTHKAIAMAEELSLRTVARLAAKLDAPTPCALGVQVARRGLLDR